MTHKRFILCIVYNSNVNPLSYQAHFTTFILNNQTFTYRVNCTVMIQRHVMFKICEAICRDYVTFVK